MYTPTYGQEKSQRPKPRVIAGAMLAVLVVSVGIAGWISHSRQAAGVRGGEVLAEIRAVGLPHFWGEGTREFFLMRRNGEPVGWRAVLRKPVGDSFRGFDVHVGAEGGFAWESWTLRNDLRAGTYVAFGPSNTAQDHLAKTEVVLSHGQVTVSETLLAPSAMVSRGGRSPRTGRPSRLEVVERYTSRADVPDNYLPEGSLPLVARQVGQRKVDASFKIVINETPPLRSARGDLTTRLSAVRATFSGNDMLQTGPRPVPTTVVTIVRGGFGHADAERTYWSPAGDLQRIAYGRSDMLRVSEQELVSVFPNALEELNTLTGSTDIGYEAEETEENADEDAEDAEEDMEGVI